MLTIDGTILFAIISFLIFLFIIKTILFQPITQVIDEREKFYAKNSKMKANSKEKSKALLEEKETKLNEARKEATEILSSTNEKNKKESDILLSEAKKEATNKIEQNQNSLNQEKQNAKIEIKNEVQNIVKSIVTKVTGIETDINIKEEKINQYLKI